MHENHELTFIEVEARLKVLRDLPLTNNHVFAAPDDDKNLPLETVFALGVS